jgi:glycosyltransferase involved in cell wall biosynthesis
MILVGVPVASRPYRVLLVDLALSFGGAEVRVLTQAKALQGMVAVCKVAVLRGSALHERLVAENLPCEILSSGRANPKLLLSLRRVIHEGGYQIVDAHNVQSILWGHLAAALAEAKGRVATIHSDYGGEYPGFKGRIYEGILRLDRLLARHYINVTEVLQEKAVRQGLEKRSTLIHNAVPIPSEPIPAKNANLLAEWGFSAEDYVVAIIGRLKPVKGHAYLLEAFATLHDLPYVKLLIVGDGPLLAELQTQVQTLEITGQVHFAGFRDDVARILPSVDCVCMASLSEGLPYTVLEAASYARPMLVTAVGGMATLFADHETALLVPPRDPAALAAGIRWLVQHPDEALQLGQATRALVKKSFSIELMMKQILEVYDKVAL